MRIGVLPFALGASYGDLESSWHAAEEVSFAALWTVDHATPTRNLSPAWEASSLIVAMAARTRTIRVGVMVFDVLLRNPFIFAASVALAQAVGGGRVSIGLGVGDNFSKLDHDVLGLPFPRFPDRVRLLEACCEAFPRLRRGESVTDSVLGLHGAALGAVDIEPPPLIVGGGSRALMEVAARHAHGWNLYTQDPKAFATKTDELNSVVAATGRVNRLERSVYFFVERVNRELPALLSDFEAAGADEAVLVLMRPDGEAIAKLARQVL